MSGSGNSETVMIIDRYYDSLKFLDGDCRTKEEIRDRFGVATSTVYKRISKVSSRNTILLEAVPATIEMDTYLRISG